jgi:hypothetical protein
MSIIQNKLMKAAVAVISCLFLSSANVSHADCMPTDSIAYLGTGFDFWSGGPYAEFAISHSWLNGTSLVTLGTGALCRLAPEPWASLCNASIALNLFWIKLEDTGNGVFVNLDLFGVWVPTSATSVCVSSSSGEGPLASCQKLTCSGTGTVCLAPGSICPGSSECPAGEKRTLCGTPPSSWCSTSGCPTCGAGETLVHGHCIKGTTQ